MKRNVDRVEHELGRWQKKAADEEKENQRLRTLLEQANEGNRQTQIMVDALLTAVTLRCGEDAIDPDDPGKVLGKRLVLSCFDVLELRRRYEIHTRRDNEKLEYIIGVVERTSDETGAIPRSPV